MSSKQDLFPASRASAASGYNIYEFSPPDTTFSTGFLDCITVKGCMEVKLPLILRKNSVSVVGWSKKVPEIAYPTLPDFAVPCHDDLRLFIGDQAEKHGNGFRSVILEVSGEVYVVHFRDTRLWSNATILYDKVSRIILLANTIIVNNLLDAKDIRDFFDTRIEATLGYRTSAAFPRISALAEFTKENWLGELVLDACTRILMDRVNSKDNKLLILPSTFYTQLTNAYHADRFCQGLKDLRESFLGNLPPYIAFVYNKNFVHWAPCIVSMNERVVMQGDSLGWHGDKNMLEKLKWLLRDVAEVQGKWTEANLDIPQQGSGSGSCGIIAINTIESFFLPDVPRWTQDTARQVRHIWLGELLTGHLKEARRLEKPGNLPLSRASSVEILFQDRTPSDPFIVESNCPEQTSIASDGGDSDGEEAITKHVRGPKFEPTVPRAMSGSPRKPKPAPLDPQRPLPGMIFATLEEAVHHAYEYEGRRGYEWKKCESRRNHAGRLLRLRLRCSSAGNRQPQHKKGIDLADMRLGKTKCCNCEARINIKVLEGGNYAFSSLSLTHNHPAPFDDNLTIYKPPSESQKEVIQELASLSSLTRSEVRTFLAARFPDHLLSLRQVTNLLNESKRKARKKVDQLGDINAIVEQLLKLKEADPRWVVHVGVNKKTHQFIQLFFMSPDQVQLARDHRDVIVNDIAMMRNKYSLPLNVWVVVDHNYDTRNIAYAFHDGETAEHHSWALDCLLGVIGTQQDFVLFSDHDLGLNAAVSKHPNIWHGRCLHHLKGNVIKNLAPALGPLFQSFQEQFWTVYHSPSPAAFERAWEQLVNDYPAAKPYLERELWPTRSHWAWAWVATRFTCGVRTSGRVEGENAVNKQLGNSKTSLYDLTMKLIKRSEDQSARETMRAREATRLRHPRQTDVLFAEPLRLLRTHCVGYALQKSYAEMESSMFYSAEELQLPDGQDNWAALFETDDVRPSNIAADEAEKIIAASKQLLDDFTSDNTHISAGYLLELIVGRGWKCTAMFSVSHYATKTIHSIAILDSGHVVCNCLMGINLGIQCRHYYSILRTPKSCVAPFHLGLFNRRWLEIRDLDVSTIPAVTAGKYPLTQEFVSSHLPPFHPESTPPPETRTLNLKVIHHQAMSKLNEVLRHVHTEADLKSLTADMEKIIANQQSAAQPAILPPREIKTRGRPRKRRLTSAIEQPGAKRARTENRDGPGRRKCGKCGQQGHYATTCGAQ